MAFATRRHVLTALLALLCGASAHAASFDCRQAKAPVERAICGSTELSALDVRLAQTYQRALRALSPTGAAALKASQRAWLRYVTQVCVPVTQAKPPVANESCLQQELQDRIQGLDQIGLKLGAQVLTRKDQYETRPAPSGDTSGRSPGVVSNHMGQVQIDDAATSAELAWNHAQHAPAAPAVPSDSVDDATSDVHSDATITCANERLLSIESFTYEYPHGAAHGAWVMSAVTVLLRAGMRPMTAADLFAKASGWQQMLPTLFWQTYLGMQDKLNTEEMEATIRDAAADERRWLITPAGLRISFGTYEGGSYADTPAPITVPWAALKPLLIDHTAPTCDFSFVDAR